MNKKTIQIILIVACFGGAGFILYNGLHTSPPTSSLPKVQTAVTVSNAGKPPTGAVSNSGSSSGAIATASVPGAKVPVVNSSDKLLPNGETFDIAKVLNKYNFQFGAYNYPVATSSDVGVSLKDLIKPEDKNPVK